MALKSCCEVVNLEQVSVIGLHVFFVLCGRAS
jgi:hypothetical protein